MTLQRYSFDLVPVGYDGARIEICTDDDGEWVKSAEHEAEVARLRRVLKSIASGCYTREAAAFIAKEALEGK